ncbi:efflux RND transporter periplasmic adaptor subunit [Paracoccus yeei]|uniref:Efflux RND transporter periplasmic adaptor subunit n=1 Tax=Paracoccus yeei TaxID=147645 RepID=A0A386UQK6_9RHOB|nr:efflux RND transporter periplasmic adaptor subunit [Paracoccus yeei]AYF02921.1 efflux RND transporter periplasmic adaptor subunit [Paracoccus yeei]
MRFLNRIPAWAALCLVLPFASESLAQTRRGPDGPTPVGVVTTAEEDVPRTVTLPGRAIAYQQTAIRPQVGGEILEIVYDPGRPVRAGDVLFRIDPETLAAALAAAEASVAGAEASLTQAQNTVTRYRRLEGSGVSAVDRANAEVALKQAEADLAAARAARDAAQLSLDRTAILSPLDGMADVPQVSVGDLVTANQSEALTTITQLDPIYVDVSESSARLMRSRAGGSAGQLIRTGAVQTRLTLETGEEYQGEGRLVSPGIAVSPTTGTVPIRLRFNNPDLRILPGQFLRVQMTLGSTRAVLVPQRATSRASDGTLTAFVVRDGRAQQVVLSEQGSYRNNWIVTQGISPGEQLILDGLDDLRAGTEVAPVPVQIDAQGVVREIAAPGPAADTPAAPAVPAGTD